MEVVVVVVVVDVVVVVVVTVDEVISPLIGSGDVSHSGGMVRGGSVGSAKYQKIIPQTGKIIFQTYKMQ